MKEGIERVKAAVKEAGVKAEIVPHGDPGPSSQTAAAAMGIEVSDIIKSMVVSAKGELSLFLLAGDQKLDLAKAAKMLGKRKVRLAFPKEVEEQLGFCVGGVPPAGHLKKIPAFIERSVLEKPFVVGSAGTEHHGLKLTPKELVKLTGAKPVDITLD